jgi:amino acid transporter
MNLTNKLFIANYVIAFLIFIIISLNLDAYRRYKKDKLQTIDSEGNVIPNKLSKAITFSAKINIIGIIILFIFIILFTINNTNTCSTDRKNALYIGINTLMLLIILITFVLSSDFFRQYKKLRKQFTDKDTLEKYIINNGTLILNISSLFFIVIMVIFSNLILFPKNKFIF